MSRSGDGKQDFFRMALNLSIVFFSRIVGDDDGGVMFTPEQYEAYKKKVLPMVCTA